MSEELEHDDYDLKDDFNLPEEVFEIYCFMYPDKTVLETGGRVSFCWENVKMIKEYNGNEDNWEKYRGSKYYLTLHGLQNDLLIHGSYEKMKQKFIRFRMKHPLFEDKD